MRFGEIVVLVGLAIVGCGGRSDTTTSGSVQGGSSGSGTTGTVSSAGISGSSGGPMSGETAVASSTDAGAKPQSSEAVDATTVATTDHPVGASEEAGPVQSVGTVGDAAPIDSGVAPIADGSSPLPPVTLFVAGDSTAAAYGDASVQQGWGEHLADFLNHQVQVDDEGFPGRNIETFMYDSDGGMTPAGHYKIILDALKPGDYVMIEFGINDSSPGSPRFLTVPVFTQLMGVMVDQIRAAKGNPILVTPSALQYWTSTDMDLNTREQPYVDAMKQVASQKNIALADLNGKSVAYLDQIGQAGAAKIYFEGDKAHFDLAGAVQMAKFVIEEVVRVSSPLGAYAVNLN